jgi:hypothetical protein
MSSSSLKDVISAYESAIHELEKNSSDQNVLAVLIARDKVKVAFCDAEEELDNESTDEFTLWILELDETLIRIAANGAWPYKVDGWRDSLGKSGDWWWSASGLQAYQKSRLDAFLNISSLILLILTAGQVISTASKFSVLNLTWLGSSAIVFQGFFAYLASKTTLTTSNQWFDHLLASLHRPSKEKAYAKLLLVAMACGTSLLIEAGCLFSSRHYSNAGSKKYLDADYISAENDLNKAIALNPKNEDALNWLGEVYEAMSEFNPDLEKLAYEKYSLAMNLGSISSINNLSRRAIIAGTKQSNKDERQRYYEQAELFLHRAEQEGLIDDERAIDLDHAKIQHDY